MKSILLAFMIMFVSIGARTETTSDEKTQADWFSPSCPNCSKFLTPGTANLGNAKGVYRPNKKIKKTPKTTTKETAETGQ